MGTFRVPIEVHYTDDGGPGVNIWSVRTSSSGDAIEELELQDAVDEIRGFYNYLCQSGTSPASLFATGTFFTLGVVVRRESDEEFTPTFTQVTAPTQGNDLPPHLACVISWRTSVRARRGMGRTFLGPLHVACNGADGKPVAGVKTLIDGAAEGLIEASDSATGWAVGIYGQVNKLPKGSTPEDRRLAPHVHRDIVGHEFNNRFAVLRSRRD